jgi:putative salt-induced outer membrane protein YdiY
MMKHLVFGLAAFATAALWADKVVLTSGSFLTGKAGAVVGDAIEFTSDDLGPLKIKLSAIASLASDRPHVVAYRDGSSQTQTLAVSNGLLVARGAPLNLKDVKAVDPVAETWHGSLNVAYKSSRGNTYDNSASVLANVNRRWEKDRFNADFGYYYTETGTTKHNKEKTTDRFELAAQHDHFWSAALYHYENGRYEQDDIAGIDYRLRLGVGLGYQWLDGFNSEKTGTWSFSQEAGAAWVRTGYAVEDPDAEDSYASFRYAHHLKYFPKWNPGIEAFHNLEYLPDVSDYSVYLMKADVGFTTKIVMDFDLLCKIEWDYDSVPSQGRKSSDVRYIVGLGYKW